jgi:hypothetical protein
MQEEAIIRALQPILDLKEKKTHLIQNNRILTPVIVIKITNFNRIHYFLNFTFIYILN